MPKMRGSKKGESGFSEADFQQFYRKHAKERKLDPNPDAKEHHYDYRSAYKAGARPDKTGHWPSKYKGPDHPNRYVNGEDTITGKKVSESSLNKLKKKYKA